MRLVKAAVLMMFAASLSLPMTAKATTPPPSPPFTVLTRVLMYSGTVTASGGNVPINCHNGTGTCMATFTPTSYHQLYTFTATPDAGYVVGQWYGCNSTSTDTTGTIGYCNYTSDSTQAISVSFKVAPPPPMQPVNLAVTSPSGALNVGSASCFSDGTNVVGTCTVNQPVGTKLTFVAQPTLGYVVAPGSWVDCAPSADNLSCTQTVPSNPLSVSVGFMADPCEPYKVFTPGGQCVFAWQDGNYIDSEISVADWTGKTRDDCAQRCILTSGCVVATYCDSSVAANFPTYANTCVLRSAKSAFYPSSQYPQYSGMSSWVNPAPAK
jgi:hypothetical protein